MRKARDFDTWAAEASRELANLGMPMLDAKHVPYDKEEWFRREFDAGEDAAMTAQEWFSNN
ncbi:hypothetical protein [Paraburkholderia humisilvae]|uniref:Uncharacterized protein n=1 Tax=Paraburkholderia humisilvae TaxID=627669 RepID=A0A6J5F880_9BURK|nr:hypothetical protein [Paraburkholderia humisilvae]CAB3774583.1 hypothetical protein LMG29542_07961 [Paraburkholderia humisilvae]